MNWVDLAIIVIVFFFAFEGFGRQLILEAYDLISFIIAFLLSLKFFNYGSGFLESNFSLPKSFSNALGFIAMWYLFELVFVFISRLDYFQWVKSIHLRYDKFTSIIPAAFRGVIFVSIILVLVGAFPIQPQIKKAVNESFLGSRLLNQAITLEGPINNVFGGLAEDSLTFMTVEPKTNETIQLGFQTSNFVFDGNMEQQMITLINKERTDRNLPPLKYDSGLQELAREHTADMLERGYFSHYSPEGDTVADRAAAHHINYVVIGENLAYAPTLIAAHQGLMNSPGHRANILSADFHKVGIGIGNAHEYGIMFTQVFSN